MSFAERTRCRAPGKAGLVRAGGGLAATILVSAGLSGCIFSSPATIDATAYFNDVSNLVAGAPVQLAGISVGTVQSIQLRDGRAKVVLSVEKSAGVRSDVKADVKQSTVLGEEVVELVEPSSGSTLSTSSAGLLAQGSTIHSTALVPGIEQFVSGGTAVVGSIGTSQLASLINAGGEGFGGQASELKRLIANLNTVMTGYSSRDGEIRTLVASMNKLSSSLAPNAEANALAISNLARTVAILDRQSGNFIHLVHGLEDLSIEGRSLLEQQLRAIDFQFSGLAGVTGTINGQQAALAQLLEQLPGHNAVLNDTTVNKFSQIVDSLIVCGLPDGGGNTSQAASTCHGAGGGGNALPSPPAGSGTTPKVGAP
ncbi:MAG: MlaD family protein [Acidimicrobiales bacterium]